MNRSKRSSKRADPFYLSEEWKALRLKCLRRDGYRCTECRCMCAGKKRGQPSPHVDHIKTRREHPELAMRLDNLRTLCPSCHSRRTRADQLDRPAIGIDGYPLDEAQALPPRHPSDFT